MSRRIKDVEIEKLFRRVGFKNMKGLTLKKFLRRYTDVLSEFIPHSIDPVESRKTQVNLLFQVQLNTMKRWGNGES